MSTDHDAIRARLVAANRSYEWASVEAAGGDSWWIEVPSVSTIATDVSSADAELIAHAPADLAALLAENERLRKVAEAAIDYMTAASEADAELAYQTMDETIEAWRADQ